MLTPTPSRLLTAAFVALAVASCASYLAWPLTNDPSIHLTGVHQALASGRGLLKVWNFRGFGYNAYLLALYQLTTSFADFFDRRHFDPLIKAVHLLVIAFGAFVWSGGLAKHYALSRELRLRATAIAVFAMTSSIATVALHAEDVGVLFMLYGWGAALRPSTRWQMAAGFAAGVLPFVKGLTVLYAAPVLGASLLASGLRSRGFASACASAVLTFAALTGFLWHFAPLQLTDLLDTITFQGAVNAPTEGRWLRFEEGWGQYFQHHPILLPGALAASLHLQCAARQRDLRSLSFVLLLWLVALAGVVVQNRYYTYHFAPVVLAAAYSLTACITWLRQEAVSATNKRSTFVVALALGALAATNLAQPNALTSVARPLVFAASLALAVTLALRVVPRTRLKTPASLLIVLMLGLMSVLWFGSRRAAATPERAIAAWNKVDELEKKYGQLVDRHRLRGKTVLLANYGTATRHLDVVSACRHFFPVPLARFNKKHQEDFEARPGYQEAQACFRKYRGDVILVQESWFSLRKLRRRLPSFKEYRVVERLGPRGRGFVVLKRTKSPRSN